MKLNGILCTKYTAGERFSAVLHNTTADEITAMNPSNLVVQADDGSTVEEFTSYGRLFSVKHIIADNTFEVVFERIKESEKLAEELGAFLNGLKEGLSNEQ